MSQLEKEKKYEEVYGDTFALYSRKEMDEFIEPFKIRLKRNGLNAPDLFKGKKCLDAGCGNGRGSLLMLMSGAAHVTAFDFSEKNIESTKKFSKDYGFNNIDFQQGTLESLPFNSGEFDFVWCNGVIMHTGQPDKCLSEISRVLNTNGKMWLYIYGSGGIYWRIIYKLRELLKGISVTNCISALRLLRYETRYVAEFIDDWFASYLRTYTDHDLSSRLETLGFEKPNLLKFGTDYDTSHRRNTFSGALENDLMGEGDLRYVLTKTVNPAKAGNELNAGEQGSEYNWPKTVTSEVDAYFEKLTQVAGNNVLLKIAAAAKIQRELRILLTESRPFPIKDLKEVLNAVLVEASNTSLL